MIPACRLMGSGWLSCPGQVFVTPFPNVGGDLWPITNEGGGNPSWSPTGRELFYQPEEGRLVAIEFDTDGGFTPRGEQMALAGPDGPLDGLGSNYDIDPITGRLLVAKELPAGDESRASITVVLNWSPDGAELFYIGTITSGQMAAARTSMQLGVTFGSPEFAPFLLTAGRVANATRASTCCQTAGLSDWLATHSSTISRQWSLMRFASSWFEELTEQVPVP